MKSEQIVQHSEDDPVGPAIAAAARSRFMHFGYAKTSMQEIAEDCGMSVANLYRYYDGKLAIGAAVTAGEQAVLFAGCDRAVAAASGGVSGKLIALFRALIDGTRRQIRSVPLLHELGMVVARQQPELRQRILHETETRIAAILATSGGGEAQADSGVASRLILLACAPFVLPWMLRTQPFGNPRAQVEPLITCLVAGLMATRRPEPPASASHRAPPQPGGAGTGISAGRSEIRKPKPATNTNP